MRELLQKAISEDIGRGDLFSLVADDREVVAKIVTKEDGVLAGEDYIKELSSMKNIDIEFLKHDKDLIKKGDLICYIKGRVDLVLKYERIILNLLQHCSGIATNTRKYVEITSKHNIKLLDTRKTRPSLRVMEKYAVRCGGGINHRLGLDDCLMLKDTHLAAIDDLSIFIKKARKNIPYTSKIEVECESFKSVKEAMEAGADIVMCDNMTPKEIKEAVSFRDENFKHVLLEASGNITTENIEKYAKLGIDAISSGSLIHQAVWLDFSMRIG